MVENFIEKFFLLECNNLQKLILTWFKGYTNKHQWGSSNGLRGVFGPAKLWGHMSCKLVKLVMCDTTTNW